MREAARIGVWRKPVSDTSYKLPLGSGPFCPTPYKSLRTPATWLKTGLRIAARRGWERSGPLPFRERLASTRQPEEKGGAAASRADPQ